MIDNEKCKRGNLKNIVTIIQGQNYNISKEQCKIFSKVLAILESQIKKETDNIAIDELIFSANINNILLPY